MNRMIRNLLLALCAMVILAAGTALYAYYALFVGGQERVVAEEAAKQIVSLGQDEIREITIVRHESALDETTTLRAVKQEDAWRLEEPLQASGDSSAWDGIARSLAEAKHVSRFPFEELASADLGQFGLATPDLIVSVAGIGGASAATLAIGKKNPVGGGSPGGPGGQSTGSSQVYARFGRDEAVLTMAESVKNTVDKKLFDLRDKRIVTFETDDVRRVEVGDGESKYRLDRLDGDRWQISQPFEAQADGIGVRGFISKVDNARIKQFIDETPSDYGTYGLTDEATRVVFWVGDAADTSGWVSQAVLLGATSEVTPSNVYTKRESQDNVFAVELSAFAFPGDANALRLQKIVPVSTWDVNHLAISVAGEKIIEVSKSAGEWQQNHPVTGKATWSSVNDLLKDVCDLKVAEFVSEGGDLSELGLDENDLVIELTGKETSERVALSTVRGGTDGLRYGLRQPPREVYSVRAADIQKILDGVDSVELEAPPAPEPEESEDGESEGSESESSES